MKLEDFLSEFPDFESGSMDEDAKDFEVLIDNGEDTALKVRKIETNWQDKTITIYSE
jgi:hypothetical protein